MKQPAVMLVGSGQMGRSALRILLAALPQARFTVVDRSAKSLDAARALDPQRVKCVLADVFRDGIDVGGASVVINFAGPFYLGSTAVALAAIAAGANYVDVCDDVEGIEAVLSLDAEAKAAGVTLVTGAGLSPGVANWISARLLAQRPAVDGIRIVWVVREADPGGLAVLKHMLHMAVTPCPTWVDGQLEHSRGFVPETAETFVLPAPFGETEAYDTAHPEPITLPREFPHLRLVQCKGSLQPRWANSAFSTLGRIGFGDRSLRIEIGGTEIEPVEALWKTLWARYHKRSGVRAQAATQVNVIGLEGDRPVLMHSIADDADMSRGTGLGVAAAALTILKHPARSGCGGVELLPSEEGLANFWDLAGAQGAFAGGIQESQLS